MPSPVSPRLAVRAVIVQDGRLLLVNAYPGGVSDLWCVPGGGVERGASLADNLHREVAEETGLTIAVGPLCHVSEFHNTATGFHQVEMFFRAEIVAGILDQGWCDPEGIVTNRRFFTETELSAVRFKPDLLQHLAFGDAPALTPGGLEPMVR